MSEEYVHSRCFLAGGSLYKLICHQIPNDWDIFIAEEAKLGLADLLDELNEMDEFGGIIHDFIFQSNPNEDGEENKYKDMEAHSLKFKWKDQIINFIIPNNFHLVQLPNGIEGIKDRDIERIVDMFPINRQRICSPLTLDFMATSISGYSPEITADFEIPKLEQYKKNEAETSYIGIEIVRGEVLKMREARNKHREKQHQTQANMFKSIVNATPAHNPFAEYMFFPK